MTAPTPLDYAAWRATRLGKVTEAIELRAVLDLAGSVSSWGHPPVAVAAVALAPLDPLLRRVSTLGAAFLAMEARKPGRSQGLTDHFTTQ